MNTDNQKTQIAIVVVLVLVLVGYLGYTFMMPSTQASSIPQKMTKKHNLPLAQSNGQVTASTGAVTSASAVTDPFAPKIDLNDKVSSVFSTPNKFDFKIRPLPGQGIQPSPLKITPLPVEKDPTKELIVAGIIIGEKNVAIIRSGQMGRYFVKKDDTIIGKYKVTKISGTGVEVFNGSRSYVLPIERPKNGTTKSGGPGSI